MDKTRSDRFIESLKSLSVADWKSLEKVPVTAEINKHYDALIDRHIDDEEWEGQILSTVVRAEYAEGIPKALHKKEHSNAILHVIDTAIAYLEDEPDPVLFSPMLPYVKES